MAPFSNMKAVSSLVTAVISRRGYSAASQGVVSRGGRIGALNVMLKKGSEKKTETAWVPDPVTGYYRPETQVKELDPVELRNMLTRTKSRAN